MYKVDLHTHSIISHDGGITKKQYKRLFDKKVLDCIAITDHNQTSFARSLHDELGDKIIIGEEIKTLDGDIIGLYLKRTISPGLSASETVAEIKKDGGLVYVPHPFETIRDSLQEDKLLEIIDKVDVIEVFNGRGFWRGQPDKAAEVSFTHKAAMASSSDAHCLPGIRSAYSLVEKFPDSKSLVDLLQKGQLRKKHAPFYSLICPGFNKLKNKLLI
ncbi:MAG TPA: PHP domain-containing protein [Candidatus Limnocylindrales bacterium]|nr:PHP domain-containing protein [Candidatus Limnocylindrales bacterium]